MKRGHRKPFTLPRFCDLPQVRPENLFSTRLLMKGASGLHGDSVVLRLYKRKEHQATNLGAITSRHHRPESTRYEKRQKY